MLSVIYFVFALASAHAYTTIVQKGASIHPIIVPPDGPYFIIDGQCSAVLGPQVVECFDGYRSWPPFTLEVVVDDNGAYPEIKISNDLQQAEINRLSCAGTATVYVYRDCYDQQGGQPWRAGSSSSSPKFGPNQSVLSEIKN